MAFRLKVSSVGSSRMNLINSFDALLARNGKREDGPAQWEAGERKGAWGRPGQKGWQWELEAERRAAGALEEAEARERWESKSEGSEETEARERLESKSEGSEVPVGSETPNWVEANEAVGGGGASEAQDQQDRWAGSVTERPSPPATLTAHPHTRTRSTGTDKPLMGSLGMHESGSNLHSPSDHVSQAGVGTESGGCQVNETTPAHRATSEPKLRVPQSHRA